MSQTSQMAQLFNVQHSFQLMGKTIQYRDSAASVPRQDKAESESGFQMRLVELRTPLTGTNQLPYLLSMIYHPPRATTGSCLTEPKCSFKNALMHGNW